MSGIDGDKFKSTSRIHQHLHLLVDHVRSTRIGFLCPTDHSTYLPCMLDDKTRDMITD